MGGNAKWDSFMPATVSWYKQDLILMMRYYDSVTIEAINEAYHQSRAFIENISTTVYTIIDITDLTHNPKHIMHFREIIAEMRGSPTNEVLLTVGAKSATHLLGSAVSQMTGNRFHMVNSIEEAETIIAQLTR